MTGRVLICAGESSGDLHGANLARALSRMAPGLALYGMGGARMAAAGVEPVVDTASLGIVGIVEVLAGLLKLRRAFAQMVEAIERLRPDVVVLIDSPEFNMRLARRAHKLGARVVYYIGPQVWAWRGHRIRELARTVDRMLVILPFEEELYRRAGMDVRFVGHPLLDCVAATTPRDEFLTRVGVDPLRDVVCLCPGSRANEVKHMGALLGAAARKLSALLPGAAFLVPVANTLALDAVKAAFREGGRDVPLTFVQEGTYDALAASRVAISAAGTVTLEAALLGTPTVVMYRTSRVNYLLGQMLIRVDHIALANVIASRRVFPELIQDEATPENLAREAAALVTDPARAQEVAEGLARVRTLLGAPGASDRAARAVLEMMGEGAAGRLVTGAGA